MSEEPLFNDAAAYERLMGRWSRRAGEEFLRWLDPPQGARWIDIGCGTGAFTALIVDKSCPAEVVGIDPAEEQLAFARSRSGMTGVDFRRADAERLPFSEGSFDIAAMALVVHFLRNPQQAVAEMVRVLRPGGLAAAYVWDYSAHGSPTAPMVAALRTLGFEFPGPPSAAFASLTGLEGL